MKQYDYIFTGTGLSALMTVYKMVQSGEFKDKTILLLDENAKKTNDRTWCFWSKKEEIWNNIISKTWDSALFANQDFQRNLDLTPYQYHMVKGLDFYTQVFDVISKEENINFLNQKVTDIEESETIIMVQTETESFSCSKLFNSIYNKSRIDIQNDYPVLQQHFIGWFIKSEQAVFNPEQATFMDFSVEQKGNTRFMYVLPTSKTEALVEYTLFSHTLLTKEEYETEIKNYIQKLGISHYEIIEKEQGSIPMTVLWVSNLEKSVNFYKALFEDQHPYVSESFASVRNSNNEVLLHLLPEEYRSEPTLGEDNPIKPVFTVNSIEQAKLASGQNGGRIQRETNDLLRKAGVDADLKALVASGKKVVLLLPPADYVAKLLEAKNRVEQEIKRVNATSADKKCFIGDKFKNQI